jgi:hypothetical protein
VEWDSLWTRVYGLPGQPPAVDFSTEVALLKVTSYGGGISGYASDITGARINARHDTLYISYRVRDSGFAVDTSSRKALAAAVTLWNSALSFHVQWDRTPVSGFSRFPSCTKEGVR